MIVKVNFVVKDWERYDFLKLKNFLQVNQLVSKIRNQTEAIERQLRINVDVQLTQLADVFDNPVANMTVYKKALALLKMARENNSVAANAAADIRLPLQVGPKRT